MTALGTTQSFTTYYNAVIKHDTNKSYFQDKLTAEYDEIFNSYYNSSKTKHNENIALLREIDNELLENDKLDWQVNIMPR